MLRRRGVNRRWIGRGCGRRRWGRGDCRRSGNRIGRRSPGSRLPRREPLGCAESRADEAESETGAQDRQRSCDERNEAPRHPARTAQKIPLRSAQRSHQKWMRTIRKTHATTSPIADPQRTSNGSEGRGRRRTTTYDRGGPSSSSSRCPSSTPGGTETRARWRNEARPLPSHARHTLLTSRPRPVHSEQVSIRSRRSPDSVEPAFVRPLPPQQGHVREEAPAAAPLPTHVEQVPSDSYWIVRLVPRSAWNCVI
jgi:hypothetical protein